MNSIYLLTVDNKIMLMSWEINIHFLKFTIFTILLNENISCNYIFE